MNEKPKEINELKDIQKMDIFTCLDKMQGCIDIVSKTYGELVEDGSKNLHNELMEHMSEYNSRIRDIVLEMVAILHVVNGKKKDVFDELSKNIYKNFRYLWITKFEDVFKESCDSAISNFTLFDKFEIHSTLYHTKHTINLKKVGRFPSSIVGDNSIIADKFTRVDSYDNIDDAIYALHKYAVKVPGLAFILAKNDISGEEVCPVATIFNRSGKDFKYLINKEDK